MNSTVLYIQRMLSSKPSHKAITIAEVLCDAWIITAPVLTPESILCKIRQEDYNELWLDRNTEEETAVKFTCLIRDS
jgi:hypothetical protein